MSQLESMQTGQPHGLPFKLQSALSVALFDEVECGLVVCDAEGRIALANQAAHQALAAFKTLAEKRVLAALVREASPRRIADEHAVALSTVRTQISAIRAKFGVGSIDALLIRLAQVPPVSSALRMNGDSDRRWSAASPSWRVAA